MSDNTIKWFDAKSATSEDIQGFYCLGYNSRWSKPQIRVGFFDIFDEAHRFRLIGGPYMELGPTHIAALPDAPSDQDST